MAPHSAGAQQMVLGASPRAAATSLPARVLHEAYGTGNALGGAMGDASTAGAMADANTEGDGATGGAITRARCKYTRENVRGRWLELRDRLRASGVDAPLPLEWPSLTIPKTALATMVVLLPCSGEEVLKRGPPKYADFAKSVPPQNPFTPASAHGGISQYNNGCSGSQSNSVSNITHNYNYSCASGPAATAPAAAPRRPLPRHQARWQSSSQM